jgi:hypothetical protein
VKAQELADMFRVRLNYIRKDLDEPNDFSITTIEPKPESRQKKPTAIK